MKDKSKIIIIVIVVVFIVVLFGVVNHYKDVIREKDLVIGLVEYHRDQLIEERDMYKEMVYSEENESGEHYDERDSEPEYNWLYLLENDDFRIDLTDALYAVFDGVEPDAEPHTFVYELWEIMYDIYGDYLFDNNIE